MILKCLEKNRDLRYASAQELLNDLHALKREAPEAAEKIDLTQLLPARPAATAASAPSQEKQKFQPFLRHRIVLLRAFCSVVPLLRGVLSTAGLAFALTCLTLFCLPPLGLKPSGEFLKFLSLAHRVVDPIDKALLHILKQNVTMGTGLLPPTLAGSKDEFVNIAHYLDKMDFLLLGIGVAGISVVGILNALLRKLEFAGRLSLRRKKAVETPRPPIPAQAFRPSSNRRALLREYAEFQKLLMKDQRDLTFLAVDVVSSTKMKVGEDKLTVEHAFAEYKDYLEGIFQRHRVWKATWTPDGVMSAFLSVDDAAGAAREILSRLAWFNANTHQMRSKFQVRCGMHSGTVTIPGEKPLEEVSDEVIDIAGHMQKFASTDTLWISEETYKRLSRPDGFQPGNTKLDNHAVYVWSPAATPAAS